MKPVPPDGYEFCSREEAEPHDENPALRLGYMKWFGNNVLDYWEGTLHCTEYLWLRETQFDTWFETEGHKLAPGEGVLRLAFKEIMQAAWDAAKRTS